MSSLDKHTNSGDQEQQLLEKFDRTSVLRNIGNQPVALRVFCLSVAYSLFHLYITYNPMPELLQRSAHVAIGLCLIFFL